MKPATSTWQFGAAFHVRPPGAAAAAAGRVGIFRPYGIIRLDLLGTWRIQEPFLVTSIISVGEFT